MVSTIRHVRALATLTLLASTPLLAGLALAGEIAVTASGVAHGAPDMATIDVGFSTTEADVAEALAQADAVILAVRGALEARAVDPADIRTITFTVWREERFEDRQQPGTVVYRVTHHLQVTVRDVDEVGALLVAATDAGANHVGGIQFAVQDQSELKAAARRDAYASAFDKAEQLAELAGLTLGDPISVIEATAGEPPVRPLMERSLLADTGAPVAPGQLAVEVWLEVRFGTRP
jgi:uncharacterized protein